MKINIKDITIKELSSDDAIMQQIATQISKGCYCGQVFDSEGNCFWWESENETI